MLPSQLQYRDVITRAITGCLMCTCFGIHVIQIFPKVNEILLLNWSKLDAGEILLIFIPISFVISYSIGSVMGSPLIMLQQIAVPLPKENATLMPRPFYTIEKFFYKWVLRINRPEKKKDNFVQGRLNDPRFTPLICSDENTPIYSLIRQQILNSFPQQKDILFSGSLNQIFGLCHSFVEINAGSMATEVRRQNVDMHFLAQLAQTFSFCSFCSFVCLLNHLAVVYLPNKTLFDVAFNELLPIQIWVWIAAILLFAFMARKAANKSIFVWRQYCRQTYFAFFNCAAKRKEHEKKEDEGEGTEEEK